MLNQIIHVFSVYTIRLHRKRDKKIRNRGEYLVPLILMGLKRQIVLQIGFRGFPNEISPMAISQVTISYVATSQIFNFPSGKSKSLG